MSRRMKKASRGPDSGTRWIGTTRARSRPSFLESIGGLGAVSSRADVDRIGIGPEGVTFVRARESVTVPWGELVPSRSPYGKGLLVLNTRDTTPPRGGPWTVDALQGEAILTDRRWPDPEYSRRILSRR